MGIINQIPHRKPLRLPQYNYGKPGYYFVTICTRERGMNILSSIAFSAGATPVGAIINRPSPGGSRTSVQPPHEIILTPWGIAVEGAIREIPRRYQNVTVEMFIIMPDHVHLLLELKRLEAAEGGRDDSPEVAGDGRQVAAPTAAGISTVIQQFKRAVSREVGQSIWQRGYYDHIIRNDEDLDATRQYIQNNPLQWLLNQEHDGPSP